MMDKDYIIMDDLERWRMGHQVTDRRLTLDIEQSKVMLRTGVRCKSEVEPMTPHWLISIHHTDSLNKLRYNEQTLFVEV